MVEMLTKAKFRLNLSRGREVKLKCCFCSQPQVGTQETALLNTYVTAPVLKTERYGVIKLHVDAVTDSASTVFLNDEGKNV